MKVSRTSVLVGRSMMSATFMFRFNSSENTCYMQIAVSTAVPMNSGWLYAIT